MDFDVIVLGMGVMGSAACHSLARRGVKVLGIEQFTLGHALGSSHGATRLIRKAYFEDERYVPLAKRSYQLWDQLGRHCDSPLLHRVGLLMIGEEKKGALHGAVKTAKKHRIEVEELDLAELAKRYPQLKVPEGYMGLWEPGAGYVEVERSVLELTRLAKKAGAEIHERERVEKWSATGKSVSVVTPHATYKARRLVVAAGPWTHSILGNVGPNLEIRRVPQFWLKAPPDYDESHGFPCYAFDLPEGFFYGVPRKGKRLLKIAQYHLRHHNVVRDPYSLNREIMPKDFEDVSKVVRDHLSHVKPILKEASICMYTMTEDSKFIIDHHPRHRHVVFAAGFSGHGFKFAPAVGECLAELSLLGTTLPAARFLRLPRRKSS